MKNLISRWLAIIQVSLDVQDDLAVAKQRPRQQEDLYTKEDDWAGFTTTSYNLLDIQVRQLEQTTNPKKREVKKGNIFHINAIALIIDYFVFSVFKRCIFILQRIKVSFWTTN